MTPAVELMTEEDATDEELAAVATKAAHALLDVAVVCGAVCFDSEHQSELAEIRQRCATLQRGATRETPILSSEQRFRLIEMASRVMPSLERIGPLRYFFAKEIEAVLGGHGLEVAYELWGRVDDLAPTLDTVSAAVLCTPAEGLKMLAEAIGDWIFCPDDDPPPPHWISLDVQNKAEQLCRLIERLGDLLAVKEEQPVPEK